ncbi:MAG: Tat (Twin-arginine translocation) pathway signal sequence domain protein, partial [Myxococcaceae bacterium]|nr:Tat (Twin-arginine translocation) pathway signal sequence domain protein [Myxococcaceae bacterium]
MNRSFSLDRRTLLQGLGATALLAPFAQLPALKRAQAGAPKRAMFVYVPDGCIPALWHPTGSETAFTLPAMSAPLLPIQDKLVFIKGLTMYSGGATHEGGVAKLLTGVSPKSLDVFLGEQMGASSPFRSLQLGVGAMFQNGSGSVSYVGEGQPVNPEDDPTSAFSRVFGSVSSGAGDDAAAALARRRKQSVLDASLADLAALQTKLGSTEKEKLDVHLDSLREVERRIMGAASSASCNVAGFNSQGFKTIASDYYPQTCEKEENFKLVGQLQMDLATLALSCGSTNVVSLMWSHPVSPTHILETG